LTAWLGKNAVASAKLVIWMFSAELSCEGGLKMKQLSVLALVFAVLSLVFFLLLIFLRIPFPLYPLMSWQDVLDLLTPLVLIPIYWLMFNYGSGELATPREENAFMVFASLWILGQGMHLAANSINNLAENLARTGGIDITATSLYRLIYFYDEYLSHYLWHAGVLALAGLIIYREWRRPAGVATIWWATLIAGFVYGFTYFCIFLEGQTVPLGLPFAAVVVLVALIWGRKKLTNRPLLAFFFVSCLIASIFLAGWGLYWGGFPQFSEVGLM
jgi:hypothetical protein